MSTVAYKILTKDQWAQFERDGVFKGAPIDLADGYIHLSTAEQLQSTLDKYFAGQKNLVIAEIALYRFGDSLKWEPAREGALFPHIYDVLRWDAVLSHRSLDMPDQA